jgi:Secretion system C-terminal sorting domain
MKNFLTTAALLTAHIAFCQPFIVATEGLGKYGYIEADAVSYFRINSSTHSNVYTLRARVYADGDNYVYNAPSISGCGGAGSQSSTSNISHSNLPNWGNGEIAYASVYVDYCGGSQSHTSGTGFNERSIQKLDVQTSVQPTFPATIGANGSNYLVGSFVITAGTTTGLTLKRLHIQNIGTAQETTDIPVDAIKLFYEPSTGSETFNGSESNTTLNGANSGSSTDGIFGNDNANVSIPSGGLRVYIVFNSTGTFTVGKTLNFKIINDGISISPNRDTDFGLMRVDETNISSNTAIVLPIELVDFKAVAKDNATILNWATASEKNNDHFNVERSHNATNWQTITTIKGHGTTNAPQQYNYTDVQPNAGVNYYRLKQVDDNGTFTYSKIVSVMMGKGSALKTYPNPAATELTILGVDETGSVQILDVTGKLIRTVTATNILNISDLQSGVYFVKGFDAAGAALGTTRFVKN